MSVEISDLTELDQELDEELPCEVGHDDPEGAELHDTLNVGTMYWKFSCSFCKASDVFLCCEKIGQLYKMLRDSGLYGEYHDCGNKDYPHNVMEYLGRRDEVKG